MKKIAFILIIFTIVASGCNDADDWREDRELETTRGDIAMYADVPELEESEITEIYKIGSDLAVNNGGKSATFTIEKDVYINDIWTYHWNDGQGTQAGTITLEDSQGNTYGPWQTELHNDVYWVARPEVTIPADTYTVIDSDPSTWSQNTETKGQGITWMNGIYQ